jgi:hypothetical protein
MDLIGEQGSLFDLYSEQRKSYEGYYRQGLKVYVEAQTDLAWLEIDRSGASLGGSSR